jgi:hypothetical protein
MSHGDPNSSVLANARGVSTRGASGIDWLLHAVTFVMAALLLSKNFADPDFWGHVRYGQDLLREGLPAVATYTYSAEGFRWVNHENLAEIVFAAAANAGHIEWLLILKSLVGAGVILCMVRSARRRGVEDAVAYSVGILVALNLMHFWSLRPQLFSYLFFAATVTILDSTLAKRHPPMMGRSGADHPAIWCLVPLMAVWANTHGGFVAGLAVSIAYITLQTVAQTPWVAGWLGPLPTIDAPNDRVSISRLAAERIALVVTMAAVTLLNPYGPGLHAWLLESLGGARPEIVEWRPPELLSIIWWQWWVMVAIALTAILCTRRPRNLVQLSVLTLVLWQAIEHQRHIAFVAILVGFWLPVHIADVWRVCCSWRESICRAKAKNKDVPQWLMSGTLAIVMIVVTSTWWQQVRRLPVHRDRYPVEAFQFIADHGLQGKLAVQFRWAQYSLAAFADHDIRVGFDGRFRTCYPQDVVDMYFDFAVGDATDRNRVTNAAFQPERFLEHGSPNLLLIDREQTHACATVRREAQEWSLLYRDSVAELWGRQAIYDMPHSKQYLPPEQRELAGESQVGIVTWPGFPDYRESNQPKHQPIPVGRKTQLHEKENQS